MLDFGHLPKPLTGTVDYFPGFCDSTGTVWEVWNKPRNCTSSEFCVSEVEVVEVVDLLLQPQLQEVVEEVEVLVRCQQ